MATMPTQVAQRAPMRCSRSSRRRGRALERAAGARPALELPHPIDQPAHALLERGHALVRVAGTARARHAQGNEGHDDGEHGQEETDGDSHGKHDLARAYTTAFPGPVGFVPARALTDERY